MFDLHLLKTFVSVVDSGGFTSAGERVHRTQSTVSQQIRKLETHVGRPLLLRRRAGGDLRLTEDGERLLGYARRLVVLAEEAEAVMRPGGTGGVVRLGVPEDFDVNRLLGLLSGFARLHPAIRLDTGNGLSFELLASLEAGDLDLALIKRDAGAGTALASWPERLCWVAGRNADTAGWGLEDEPSSEGAASGEGPLNRAKKNEPVPLVLFPLGCIYRNRAVHALESAGRSWRVAFSSRGLAGIQAAVSAGLGISLLPISAVLPDHRVLREEAKNARGRNSPFGPVPPTELALVARTRPLPPPHRPLVAYLSEELGKEPF